MKKFLLVDIDQVEAFNVTEVLENNFRLPCSVLSCAKISQAIEILQDPEQQFDLVLLNVRFSNGQNPQKYFEEIEPALNGTPVIIITGKDAKAYAREAMKSGASDIIIRERLVASPGGLLDAIDFSLIRRRILDEMKDKSEQDVSEHKQILRWMSGGYCMETEQGAD